MCLICVADSAILSCAGGVLLFVALWQFDFFPKGNCYWQVFLCRVYSGALCRQEHFHWVLRHKSVGFISYDFPCTSLNVDAMQNITISQDWHPVFLFPHNSTLSANGSLTWIHTYTVQKHPVYLKHFKWDYLPLTVRHLVLFCHKLLAFRPSDYFISPISFKMFTLPALFSCDLTGQQYLGPWRSIYWPLTIGKM